MGTLPTSKMEFFVKIGIFKVILCRLMILYTQYSFMRVFICVVPAHSSVSSSFQVVMHTLFFSSYLIII